MAELEFTSTMRLKFGKDIDMVLQTASAASMLYDQIWFGGYMSGGSGCTRYALPAYTDDILDDFLYWDNDYASKKYGGNGKAKATIDTVKDIATEVTLYGLRVPPRFVRKVSIRQ